LCWTPAASGEPTRLKQVILNGAYTIPGQTVPYLAPVCSSGECEWDVYGTVGVCSVVANLTAAGNETVLAQVRNMARSQLNTVFNQSLALAEEISLDRSISYTVPPALPVLVGRMKAPSGAFDPSLSGLMLSDSFLAYADAPLNVTNHTDVGALRFLEVGLHWCTKAYETKVEGGRHATREVRARMRVLNKVPFVTNFAWEPATLACYALGNCNETMGGVEVLLESPLDGEDPYAVHVWTATLASALMTFTMYDSMLVDLSRGIISESGGGIGSALAAALYGDFLSTKGPSPEEQWKGIESIASNMAVAITNM
jgi:hypothetical protein